MKHRARAGFSLIETIIAMTIVSIAFTVLFGGLSTAARGTGRIGNFDDDLESARSMLAAIDLLDETRPGEQATATTPDRRRWQIDTAEFIAPMQGSTLGVVRLRLSLQPGSGGNDLWNIDSYKLANMSLPARSLQEQLDDILQ